VNNFAKKFHLLSSDSPTFHYTRGKKKKELLKHLQLALELQLHGAGEILRRYPTSKGKGEAPKRWQEG